VSFGYHTALGIATEAIDRLHSTAHSHYRIVVVEIMGHRAGWLALGRDCRRGGRDFAAEFLRRGESGRSHPPAEPGRQHFSVVAVAEGAMSLRDAAQFRAADEWKRRRAPSWNAKRPRAPCRNFRRATRGNTLRLAKTTGGIDPSGIARHHSRLRPARPARLRRWTACSPRAWAPPAPT